MDLLVLPEATIPGYVLGGDDVDDTAMARALAELAALAAAFERGLVLAAHDVSDGGLVTALAEMAFPTLATAPIVRLPHAVRPAT